MMTRLVIFAKIANAWVKRIMVDTGSSVDILYFSAFWKLGIVEENLTPMLSVLTRFTSDSISPRGTTILLVTLGEESRSKTVLVTFMVVELPLAYNAILGRPILNKLRAVIAMYHRVIKFPT